MKKILDFGAGENPYFLRFEIPWNIKDEYYYCDIDDKRLVKASVKLLHFEKKSKGKLLCNLKVSDSFRLPYKNGFFDSVIMSNFLSAPMHWLWNSDIYSVKVENLSGTYKRKLKKFKNSANVFYKERKIALKEAVRVLKPGGNLFIYTDLIIYAIDSYNKLLDELKNDKNFKVYSVVKEAKRIDMLNVQKLATGKEGWYFAGDVLPKSHVYRITKKPPK